MKLFNKNIFTILASAALLVSCSDDMLQHDGDAAKTGIVFYVPDVPQGLDPATRAITNVNDFNGNEAEIKNLRIFAYKDGAENPICIDLKRDGTPVSTSEAGYSGYRYTQELENGEYEMYAVANSSISSSTTKTQLLKETAVVPANLSDGIPMSCSNERLQVRYGSGGYDVLGTGKRIKVEPGGEQSVSIKADLRFAVAKVRVTLVNDLRPGDLVSDVKVLNHANSSALIESGAVPAGTTASDLSGRYYALDVTKIPTDSLKKMNVEKSELAGKEFTPGAGNSQPYLWQTVFYLPERLIATEANASKISMKIGDNSKEQPLGEKDGANRKLERSNFYDYIGLANGQFQMQTQLWTPLVLAGVLNGEYWLKLDATNITISAGHKTRIAYQTNAVDIVPESPKYNGEDIYSFSKENGVLTVTVNSGINREEYNAIKQGKDWEYFTITAGTLVKKVKVTSFLYSEYIMDDTMFTIDVNERKSSGEYSGSRGFTLTTNLDRVKFEKVAWEAAADAGEEGKPGSDPSIQIQDKNGNAITFGSPVAVEENGEINFSIAYNGLNSNRELWKDKHDLKMVVKGIDQNGNVLRDEGGNEVTCEVMIYIRPSYDTYKIHFYAPGWKHPHIYVYQCLQLPGDHPSYPNKPVGYIKGQAYAALEYDFTGAVAFKGWYSDQYNNPLNPGQLRDNFFVFYSEYDNGGKSWYGVDWNSYPYEDDNPNQMTPYFTRHYNRLDFCKGHREKLQGVCSECTKTGFASSWPGIHMIPDPTKPANSGWWYFELSGVADPGKALVMFTDFENADTHAYAGNGNDPTNYTEEHRYPYKRYNTTTKSWEDMPGVALFDYPTKEGWFVYEGHLTREFPNDADAETQEKTYIHSQFHPEDPDVVPINPTYTVYYTTTWSKVNVYYYKADDTEFSDCSWPGKPMTKGADGKWTYKIPQDAGYVIFNNGNSGAGNQTENIPVQKRDGYTYSGNVKTQ